MPCKIQIKKKITEKVENLIKPGFIKSLKEANELADDVNQIFNANVVKFIMFNDVLDTDINIPEDMIDRYYASELKLEQSYLDDARKQQIEDAERAGEEYTDNYLFDEAENEGISNYNVNQPTEIKPKIDNSDKQFSKLSPNEQNKYVATESTIRDLAARMADRIGTQNIRFISDRTKEFKGYNEKGEAVINLAYAGSDTPIHEILGHPIISAIKNKDFTIPSYVYVENTRNTLIKDSKDVFTVKGAKNSEEFGTKSFNTKEEAQKYADKLNQARKTNTTLYKNLLKELETGRGKEVLDRIKRDYVNKEGRNPYKEVYADKITEQYIKDNPESFKTLFLGKYQIYSKTPNTWYIFTNEEKTIKSDLNAKELSEFINKNTDVSGIVSLFDDSIGKYTLKEQQEEAIVTLLGELTADKLDKVKDKKLIYWLRQLLREMTAYLRSLFNSKEIEIDKLRADMTLDELSTLLAYSNSKIILPGSKVEYQTPDGNKFTNYKEASNHISELTKNVKDVDLSKININTEEKRKQIESKRKELDKQLENVENEIREANKELDLFTFEGEKMKSKIEFTPEYSNYLTKYKELQDSKLTPLRAKEKQIFEQINDIRQEEGMFGSSGKTILNFIEKNKEYEQSKEIIEEWKKVNNIVYNPEEVYSRGQGFYSSIGAYSTVELDLLLQNLLHHIEDNKKAGGEFTISAFTKPIDKRINHLEKESSVRFVIYPKSEHIKWAAPTDVFSGSVWDAHEKVTKDKKSELLGVSFTKAPSLQNINEISPNLADVIDNLSHHHNELGIELTTNNFRLEVDENVPYDVKKLVRNINNILDEKYGKLVKPEISEERAFKEITREEFENAKSKGKITKPSREKEGYGATEEIEYKGVKYVLQDNIIDKIFYYKSESIQPTQTNKTLKESIKSVKSKYSNEVEDTDGFGSFGYDVNGVRYVQSDDGTYSKSTYGFKTWTEITKEEYENNKPKKNIKEKEYTSQALINTKIAALKEVAKKYPRSLITSKVVPVNQNNERQYSRVNEEQLKPNTDDLIINEKLSPELMEEINTLVAYIKSKLYDVALAEKDIDSADLLKKAIGAKNIEEVNKIYKEILDNIC